MVGETVRIAVIDDHRVFCEALSLRLSDEPDFEVVGSARTRDEALELLERTRPDVVTLDLALGEENGLVLARDVAERWPDIAVLVVTGLEGDEEVMEAVRLGVRGWVHKTGPVEELAQAIRGAVRGETHIPATLLTKVLRGLSSTRTRTSGHEADGMRRLSQREQDVLGCLVEGLTRTQIAALLEVSPNTVRTHIQSVLHKLDVHSALTAVAIARRAGMTGLSPELAARAATVLNGEHHGLPGQRMA